MNQKEAYKSETSPKIVLRTRVLKTDSTVLRKVTLSRVDRKIDSILEAGSLRSLSKGLTENASMRL